MRAGAVRGPVGHLRLVLLRGPDEARELGDKRAAGDLVPAAHPAHRAGQVPSEGGGGGSGDPLPPLGGGGASGVTGGRPESAPLG